MTNDPIGAAAEGVSRDPLAPRGSLFCEIDMAALRELDMSELHGFRAAVHTITEVISGLCCQPRFLKERGDNYNGAGELLESITAFLDGYEQAAVNVATAATPTASREVERRHWTILGFDADMADDLASFAVRATEAVRDEAKAEFRGGKTRHSSECGGIAFGRMW